MQPDHNMRIHHDHGRHVPPCPDDSIKTDGPHWGAGRCPGAFGAHRLEDRLAESGRIETWKTAALYHLVHTVVLLVLASRDKWAPAAWILFASGISVFSGSLYILCLSGICWPGAITPLERLLLFAGWVRLAIRP